MKKTIKIVCFFCVFLTGCQVQMPQKKVGVMTLYDKKNGSKWVGTFTGEKGSSSGEASITVDRDFYQGEWLGVKDGGSASQYSSSANKFSGVTSSASGVGQIYLNAKNGRFIKCEMIANSISRTAIGGCRRNDGRVYDLTMKL